MKNLSIVSIAAIALTHSAQAKGWMWFDDDIGLSSPFVSLSPSATKGAVRAAPKVAAKRTPASKRAVVKAKLKSTNHRVSAR
jgi:hypothetical protein